MDEAKLEILKVWYTVFCTIVDAYKGEEYSDFDFMHKMVALRKILADKVPEVEAMMRQPVNREARKVINTALKELE